MRYVITYDIGDDATRQRVSQVLEGYGVRVQASVFECALRQGDLEELTRRLAGLVEACDVSETAEVRIYRLCPGCLGQSFGIGRAVRTPAADRFLVV